MSGAGSEHADICDGQVFPLARVVDLPTTRRTWRVFAGAARAMPRINTTPDRPRAPGRREARPVIGHQHQMGRCVFGLNISPSFATCANPESRPTAGFQRVPTRPIDQILGSKGVAFLRRHCARCLHALCRHRRRTSPRNCEREDLRADSQHRNSAGREAQWAGEVLSEPPPERILMKAPAGESRSRDSHMIPNSILSGAVATDTSISHRTNL